MMKGILKLSPFLILLADVFMLPAYGDDCNKAKEIFGKAVKMRQDTAGLIQNEQLFIKAIDLCPSYVEAHNNLGDVYEKQGKYDKAIKEYETVSAL